MTREEAMEYRRKCPYDAMGDYSVFLANNDAGGEPESEEGGDSNDNSVDGQ